MNPAIENAVSTGLSQFTGGANGLITSSDSIGNPNTYCLKANTYAPLCVIYQKDSTTGYVTVTWLNTGTAAVPAWTAQAVGVTVAKVTLTSAQILALSTTPIVLVPAPASTAQAIEVLSVMGRMNFLTAAYATNTELDIIDTTIGTKLFEDTSVLLTTSSGSKLAQVPANTNSLAALPITAGGSVSAKVATGNPTAGAGTLDLYVTYRLITL